MPARRPLLTAARPIAVAVLAAAALAGCASTTDGTGTASTLRAESSPSATSAASTPTTSPPSPSPAPVSTSAVATSSAIPAPSAPVRTATVTAGSVTYPISVWAETTDADCAEHAYGAAVIAYLTAHPCQTLTRVLATTTVGGRRVGFNQSTVSFTGDAPAVYGIAGSFRTLVLQDGTGNVNDLLTEGRRLPAGPTQLPSPDAFTALAQDASVTIYDAWYLDGSTPDNDPALLTMAQNIYLQF